MSTSPSAASLRSELDGLLELLPVGVWISRDASCDVIEGNAEAYRQLRLPVGGGDSGWVAVDGGSPRFEVWIDGHRFERQNLPMQQAARHGRSFTDVNEEIRFADGTRVQLQVSCVPLFDASGRPSGMLASSVDISRLVGDHAPTGAPPDHDEAEFARRTSELRETYDRVRDFERNALTGTIATGLGHDLGNLLLPLRLRLDGLRRMNLPEEARSDLAAIETAVNYLQQLSTGLRWLASDSATGTDAAACTRIGRWIADTESTLRNLLPPGVTLALEIPRDLPPLLISQVALTQLMSNLVVNAGYAVRGRPDALVRVSAALTEQGDAVRLLVQDNGPALDDEGLERSFEPFFSARQRQSATGLGLAIVRSLVRRAGGETTVTTAAGAGATFIVAIPVASREDDSTNSRTPAAITVHGERRQALLRTILAHDGYGVVAADNVGSFGRGVWISDLEPPHTLDALQAYVASHPKRRALVIGHPELAFDDPRIINAGMFDDIPALRAALEHVPAFPSGIGGTEDAED